MASRSDGTRHAQFDGEFALRRQAVTRLQAFQNAALQRSSDRIGNAGYLNLVLRYRQSISRCNRLWRLAIIGKTGNSKQQNGFLQDQILPALLTKCPL